MLIQKQDSILEFKLLHAHLDLTNGDILQSFH